MKGRRDFLKATGSIFLANAGVTRLVAGQTQGERPASTTGREEKGFDAPKVTRIEIFKLSVPRREPFTISLGTVTAADAVLVRVYTDKGIHGVGECCPHPYINGETQAPAFEMAKTLAPLLKGRNPLAIEERMNDLDQQVVRAI